MNPQQSKAWQALGIGPALVSRSAVVTPAQQAGQHSSGHQPVAVSVVDPTRLSWPELAEAVISCEQCQRCTSRQNPVLGVGSNKPRWLVVGDTPDEQEDRAGELFAGPSGQLLDAMLLAVGANRHDHVFLANALKCAAPQQQRPQPDDVAKCRPYLRRQIELLQPELILAAGDIAAQALLETNTPVEQLRGRVHRIELDGRTVPVVVCLDPAHLLRQPEDKAGAWADLCLARSVVAPAHATT